MKNRVDTFANRLHIAMQNNNLNQVELAEKTLFFDKQISQSLINKYLKGKAFARQDNISILCKILDVDEAWIMGFDVPMKRTPSNNYYSISLNTDEFDKDDIEEIERFIEFVKNKKKKI